MFRRPTLPSLTACALGLVAACGGSDGFRPRDLTGLASDPKVDANLAVAHQSVLRGDLEAAEEALRRVLERHPRDPAVPTARLQLARVLIGQNILPDARSLAVGTEVRRDPALALSRQLVLGLLEVRAGRPREALTQLRPLEGRLTDRMDTAHLSCALAEAESEAGEGRRALRALASIETLVADGVTWSSTGLACERQDARNALLARLLDRTNRPQELADALDAMPAATPMRRPIALRLRDLAEAAGQTQRWLRWLTDLPDETATQAPIVAPSGPELLVVGVIAPLTGPRSVLGVSLVRGAQYALEGVNNARVVADDEGSSPAEAVAALDRLAAQGARAVVGVSREDFCAGVAIRAQALGIDLYLIAPSRGVEGAGRRIHLAGPALEDRATALAEAARTRSARVTIVTPEGPSELVERVSRELQSRGASVTRATIEQAVRSPARNDSVNLVLGSLGREARAHLGAQAARAPARWLFDARSALPGGSGTWIGASPGPALPSFVSNYCARVGDPPDEFALLSYDAARRAAASARGLPAPQGALTEDWVFASAQLTPELTNAPSGAPAAAARCPPARIPSPIEEGSSTAPGANEE